MRFEDEDVGEIAESRVVGDDSGEADELVVVVEAETERVLDGPVHDLSRDPPGPVGFPEEFVDHAAVEPVFLRRDRESVPRPLHGQSRACRISGVSMIRMPLAGCSTAPTRVATICASVTGYSLAVVSRVGGRSPRSQ